MAGDRAVAPADLAGAGIDPAQPERRPRGQRSGDGAYRAHDNDCGDATVTRFLLTGERPERDRYCAS